MVHHEQLSVDIFNRILTNPKVLGEFVYKGLDAGHVKLVGNMISPPKMEECDDRLFLYEVWKSLILKHGRRLHSVLDYIII